MSMMFRRLVRPAAAAGLRGARFRLVRGDPAHEDVVDLNTRRSAGVTPRRQSASAAASAKTSSQPHNPATGQLIHATQQVGLTSRPPSGAGDAPPGAGRPQRVA